MSSVTTEQLPFEQAAEIARAHTLVTEKKWPRRRAAAFVIGASTLIWALIILAVWENF